MSSFLIPLLIRLHPWLTSNSDLFLYSRSYAIINSSFFPWWRRQFQPNFPYLNRLLVFIFHRPLQWRPILTWLFQLQHSSITPFFVGQHFPINSNSAHLLFIEHSADESAAFVVPLVLLSSSSLPTGSQDMSCLVLPPSSVTLGGPYKCVNLLHCIIITGCVRNRSKKAKRKPIFSKHARSPMRHAVSKAAHYH